MNNRNHDNKLILNNKNHEIDQFAMSHWHRAIVGWENG